ncbi:hypothetical protein RF679_12875 [Undibacterium cyanobacteriorum]|uniref:HEPN domain-containing protein n=1 Tax=Undibacterium cyanobacteriorum TaxID=3073561 RepID=A0ABY9RFV3_9BURK|nr:hypothetical protein [Undibacterium sp. 20NA77.5]WMW79539.1 hypothetical protein RF679_12875 [Undibacterium sp. 20NA77.5]
MALNLITPCTQPLSLSGLDGAVESLSLRTFMMDKPTEKLLVAAELLDRALRLCYGGDSFFSALHLAGAAEEIFGAYVTRKGGKSAFKNLQTGAIELSQHFNDGSDSTPKDIADLLNSAKNRTKHLHVDANDDDNIYFEPKRQAHDLLDRAVSNYYCLMAHFELPETELVRRFNSGLISRET